MRRGWKSEWDWVERKVWTGIAFVWAFYLVSLFVLWPLGQMQVVVAQNVIGTLWLLIIPLTIAHGFVYVGLWLRRQLAPPPSGKERDR